MDITQEFIKQQLGEFVNPWYSETNFIPAVPVTSDSVVFEDFVNEKVKVILCTNIWICYNSVIAPVQIKDIFNRVVFETPAAPGTNTQIMGMYPFNYLIPGSAIKFVANNVNFKFTVFFQKVTLFNEKV